MIALGMIAESHLGLEEMCATNSIKVGSRGCDRMQGAKGQMGVGGGQEASYPGAPDQSNSRSLHDHCTIWVTTECTIALLIWLRMDDLVCRFSAT